MPINRSFGGRNRGANPHGGRLPPGQSLVDNFPVLTAGPAPRVPDLADWGTQQRRWQAGLQTQTDLVTQLLAFAGSRMARKSG